jgi:CMP-N-acetylneuraminic acid synthetase
MIGGMSVLAVIPARGGSTGIPGKNILELAERPFIAWTIDAGHGCEVVDRLIVSSDGGRQVVSDALPNLISSSFNQHHVDKPDNAKFTQLILINQALQHHYWAF